MLVHEPDGATTYSLSLKISMNRFAKPRASSVNPLLKPGCPQHVCSDKNSTSTPSFLRTVTTDIPVSGKNWSTRQVINNETFIGSPALPYRQWVKKQGEELPPHSFSGRNWRNTFQRRCVGIRNHAISEDVDHRCTSGLLCSIFVRAMDH